MGEMRKKQAAIRYADAYTSQVFKYLRIEEREEKLSRIYS